MGISKALLPESVSEVRFVYACDYKTNEQCQAAENILNEFQDLRAEWNAWQNACMDVKADIHASYSLDDLVALDSNIRRVMSECGVVLDEQGQENG